MFILEHKLVPNSDSCNVIKSICLDSLPDSIALSDVGCSVRREDVVSQINFDVNFGLLDGFKLIRGSITAVTPRRTIKIFTTRADWLQSAP